jgi:hypothetical protein
MMIRKFKCLLKLKNLIDDEEETKEEINLVDDDENNPHITQEDYDQSLSFGQFFDEENLNNMDYSSSQYRLFVDAIHVELHNKYDLRPRSKKVVDQNPPKKILTRDKSNEFSASKQPIDQPSVKNQHITKIQTIIKEKETKPKEPEKSIGTFNMEHEINKIKIPVPLFELTKNVVY